MIEPIQVSDSAQVDLNELTDYFLAEAGTETAGRFVEQARLSFNAVARTPGLGTPVATRAQHLGPVRKWRVDGFRKILIFYQPLKDGVRIIRVLHASADWWSLLDVN